MLKINLVIVQKIILHKKRNVNYAESNSRYIYIYKNFNFL